MTNAIAFCRRSTNMQDMSLGDKKGRICEWAEGTMISRGYDLTPFTP